MIELENLIDCSDFDNDVIIAVGEWNFEIPLDCENPGETISIESVTVQSYIYDTEEMIEVELYNISITSTGISYSYNTAAPPQNQYVVIGISPL